MSQTLKKWSTPAISGIIKTSKAQSAKAMSAAEGNSGFTFNGGTPLLQGPTS